MTNIKMVTLIEVPGRLNKVYFFRDSLSGDMPTVYSNLTLSSVGRLSRTIFKLTYKGWHVTPFTAGWIGWTAQKS